MRTNIGVALFGQADPHSGETHFACEHGKPTFSFQSISELPSQTLWVTNLTFDTLRKYGLHKNPKLAHNAYFRTSLIQIVEELGLRHLEPEKQASFLACLLGNTANLVRQNMGLQEYPSRSIGHAVGRLYGTPEGHPTTVAYQVAERASQRYTHTHITRSLENAERFTFWFPRYGWAKKMLECRLPLETIHKVSPMALPNGGQDANEVAMWAHESGLPIFAKIKIHSLEENMSGLLNYGAGAKDVSVGGYEARNFREWVALPELSVLVECGQIEILDVLAASGWREPQIALRTDMAAQVSYSYGLAAENLWCGLMRKPSEDGRISKTLSTAWLQSYDRMETLFVAERLAAQGVDIISYGNGRITVAVPAALKALIPQMALTYGLMYPASIEGLNQYPISQHNPTHIMQKFIHDKSLGSLLKADQMLAN